MGWARGPDLPSPQSRHPSLLGAGFPESLAPAQGQSDAGEAGCSVTLSLCNASRELFSSMAPRLHPGSQPLTQARGGGSGTGHAPSDRVPLQQAVRVMVGAGGNTPYARRTSKKAAWPSWAAVRKRSRYEACLHPWAWLRLFRPAGSSPPHLLQEPGVRSS